VPEPSGPHGIEFDEKYVFQLSERKRGQSSALRGRNREDTDRLHGFRSRSIRGLQPAPRWGRKRVPAAIRFFLSPGLWREVVLNVVQLKPNPSREAALSSRPEEKCCATVWLSKKAQKPAVLAEDLIRPSASAIRRQTLCRVYKGPCSAPAKEKVP